MRRRLAPLVIDTPPTVKDLKRRRANALKRANRYERLAKRAEHTGNAYEWERLLRRADRAREVADEFEDAAKRLQTARQRIEQKGP